MKNDAVVSSQEVAIPLSNISWRIKDWTYL